MILPRLNVARRPIIQQHIAKDHLVRFGHAGGVAHIGGGADDGPHLELDIKALAGAEIRGLGVRRFDLPVGPPDVGAGDDNGRGAAVIADGHVQPVRGQRVFRAPKHGADVGRMVPSRVEIGVFRDDNRHVQADVSHGDKMRGDLGLVGAAGCQQVGQAVAQGGPCVGAQIHDVIPIGHIEDGIEVEQDQVFGLYRGHVEHHIPDRHAAARFERVGGKHTVGQVVEREVGVGAVRAFNPRGQQCHRCSLRVAAGA